MSHSTRQLPFYSAAFSFLTLSIRDTPTKLVKHFISRILSYFLSAPLIRYASAPYNGVGTITPSCRHFFAFIPNPLLLSTFFSAPRVLNPIHSLYYIPFISSIRHNLRSNILNTIHSL